MWNEKNFGGGDAGSMEMFDSGTELFFCFSMDNESFAVPISDVKEICPGTEIHPVPLAPGMVSGLIDLRGRIVTLLDLFHEEKPAYSDSDNAVVFNSPNDNLGFRVPGQVDPVALNASAIEKIRDEDEKPQYFGFIEGNIRKNNSNYNVISVDKVKKQCREAILSAFKRQQKSPRRN